MVCHRKYMFKMYCKCQCKDFFISICIGLQLNIIGQNDYVYSIHQLWQNIRILCISHKPNHDGYQLTAECLLSFHSDSGSRLLVFFLFVIVVEISVLEQNYVDYQKLLELPDIACLKLMNLSCSETLKHPLRKACGLQDKFLN